MLILSPQLRVLMILNFILIINVGRFVRLNLIVSFNSVETPECRARVGELLVSTLGAFYAVINGS